MLDSATLMDRLAKPGSCVLPLMLDRQAKKLGDAPLILFDDGPAWSYRETRRQARGTAAALQKLGVRRGDRVLVWLPDGPPIFRISLGLWYLGAVMAPLNPELEGEVLARLIDYADSRLMIADAGLLSRLDGMRFKRLERIAAIGGAAPDLPLETVDEHALDPLDCDPDPLDPPLRPWDVHTIFFTSGTTGVSKGVESTHIHAATMAIDGLRYLTPEDRFATPCGFFHIGGAYAPWGVIAKGASMAMVGRFSASRFLDQIRRLEVTMALMIGVMCDFLMSRPPREDDAENPLRMVIMQPLMKDVGAFMHRFGTQIYTQYDQTETPPPMTSDLIESDRDYAPGFCGRGRPGFDLRIVDAYDCEVPAGESGELTVRCNAPWVLAARYFNMPEQTARAWRNGWFHTGDIFRKDRDGNYYFVDRSKDVIRRRGENISSFAIESALAMHPEVAAAAAYAVQAEHSESEIMAALEPAPGAALDPAEIASFLQGKLPQFMLPRFLRVLPALPRSASDKVRKPDLQTAGVTADTWDRLNDTEPQEVVHHG